MRKPWQPSDPSPLREAGADGFPAQAMSRAASTPMVPGNRVLLQFEGSATFERWLEAIAGARHFVHFENYVVRDDSVGRRFRDVLVERARAGVEVRVLYDWVGCWATRPRYWRPFREAGVEVRAFNRPTIRDPFGLLQRDHRKLVCVDGRLAFIGGFCVGEEWAGRATEAPWRDTGVEIRGPAAARAGAAFERIWAELAPPPRSGHRSRPEAVPPEGDTPIWIIEGEPWRTRVYRTTQLVAAAARHRIWITDPYFVAPRSVMEALTSAARDGVDVRVLVPGHNNWPWVGSLSRGGYRRLLREGVRIFEWQGPMIHAKTAVADGIWCRVGSSNLNSASLLGNWELDAGILDEDLARQLEGLFQADLASSVEIVLPSVRVPERPPRHPPPKGSLQERLEPRGRATGSERGRAGRSSGRTLTLPDLARAGTALGESIAGHRVVGPEDRTVLGTVAGILLLFAVLALLFPRAIAWILGALVGWMGLVLAIRVAIQTVQARREEGVGSASPTPDAPGGGSDEDPGGT